MTPSVGGEPSCEFVGMTYPGSLLDPGGPVHSMGRTFVWGRDPFGSLLSSGPALETSG